MRSAPSSGGRTPTTTLRLVTAALPLICAVLIWLSLAPYPWPVNPFPYPWPVNPYPWWVQWVFALLALAVVALAGSEHWAARRVRGCVEGRALGLALAGMAVVGAYGWVSGLIRFQSFAADLNLAIFASICWNTLQGRPFEWFAGNYLTLHLSLVPMLLVPFCAVGQGAQGLLFGHSLLLTLPALPLFLLARRRLDGVSALLLSWAYLLLPGVFTQYSVGGTEAPLIALPLSLSFLFYHQGRLRAFLASVAVGAVGVVEYYAPVFALFGLLAWRARRPMPWVLGPLGVAVLWPALAYSILLPSLAQAFPEWSMPSDLSGSGMQYYRHLGESPAAVLAGVARDPRPLLLLLTDHFHVGFVYQLLLPFLFVLPWASGESLFALWELATVLPTASQNVISLAGHHVGLASVSLLFGSVGTLERLIRRGGEEGHRLIRSLAAAVLSLAGASIMTVAYLAYPVTLLTHPRPSLAEAVALIPSGLPVAAPEGVLPHLVDRREVYPLWGAESAVREARLAAVLLDHPPGQMVDDSQRQFLEWLRGHPAYRLAYEGEGVVLFLRRAQGG